MLNNISNANGVKKLSNSKLKEISGGDVTGKGDANPNITWKCYRNDLGANFFFSSVDLNSTTTVCYAMDRYDTAPIATQPNYSIS